MNSFLNTAINWYPGNGINLDLNAGWVHDFGNTSIYDMNNPFANNHVSDHIPHLHFPTNDENDRDFRWEDGWELLWMNTGKYPNGDPNSSPALGTYYAHGNQNSNNNDYSITNDAINPSNVPYFVLYNRYRGVIRLFANIWQGGSTNTNAQEWAVTMKYTDSDKFLNNISGIFRHAFGEALLLKRQ